VRRPFELHPEVLFEFGFDVLSAGLVNDREAVKAHDRVTHNRANPADSPENSSVLVG
jgi:hypothetical protein